METQFTEQDSLRVIHEMIENSKAKLKDNGFFYLLWGWLVLIASLSNFFLLKIEFEQAWLPWPVLMFSGGIVSGIAGYRLGKKAKVRTMLDSSMIYLWYGFLVTLLIILISGSSGKISWSVMDALIIALYGLGTFVSGGILKFKPLIFGGIFSWGIAIVTLFIPDIYCLLMVALSIVVSYLIPGYMLRSRFNNNSHV
ncbi:MAG: hypothetical protein B6D61_02260 [Bacteroidetes bacterium 4484_249]|nr:MAG: hypothetical protein B6D61_02260 [Bacteroidetes bacterium 4484_249]